MAFFGLGKEKKKRLLAAAGPAAAVRGTNGDLALYEHTVRIQRKNQNKDILLARLSPFRRGSRASQSRSR
jgi:hypothetical protein